ncbi:palmitoyltransferas-like protein akr1 [Rhizodiscina lignyota]|uniref:Palmitoyltransferase n=1 Tax=Rhizodiscina lignyota TaxID=1504668 RepID=A0A9P4M1Y8_9PEZI|nr:palmitoyltransferas-like protein akr1 [Rhizodiscina lignyota]
MNTEQKKLPIEEDIMQLARLGEIGAIQKLFDSGKFDATYRDDQGITPLHWAAINGHYALCHFLIQAGAPINAKGGDAVATPVLWAAKRCNYYIVNLLLQHGADPLLTDDQGFNLLHSATLDGNVFQLALLLHQDIPVDIPDSQGHTSLMWAAYKGYPACVDVLLNWGANVYARDDNGFTALHWALVKGGLHAIQKLIEYGSDRFAETNEGKTPATVAKEMNSLRQWQRALSDGGYNPDGSARSFPLSSIVKDRRWFLSRFFFLWPTVILFIVLNIMSHMVIYLSIPISLFVAYFLQWVAQQALRWTPPDMKGLHKTPFLSGVFAGTLFWVWVRWLTKLMPWTIFSAPLLNVIFGVSIALCTYFYFLTMVEDPGYVPKSGSRNQQKAVIDDLLEAQKFDEQNFCIPCMVRRPLRSKHCKRCNRCVAKHDHHCPWVDNCIGINNHRHFVLYVLTMEIGVVVLVWLTLSYLDALPAPVNVQCNVISNELCTILNKDPYTIVLVIWSILQLTWVTMLLFVQLVQIGRAQTTFESMRRHMHGNSAADAFTTFATTGTTSLAEAELTSSDRGPDPAAPRAAKKEGCWGQWKRLLGVDTFMATAIHGSNAQAVMQRQRQNPFTRGMLTNCKDFWCDPAPLFRKREMGQAMLDGERVDYTKMYVAPPRMVMRPGGEGGRYAAVDGDENV